MDCNSINKVEHFSSSSENCLQPRSDSTSLGNNSESFKNSTIFSPPIDESTEDDIFFRYKQYNDDYRNELCIDLDERFANLEREYKMYRVTAAEREIRLKQNIEKLETQTVNYDKQISCLCFEKSQLENSVKQLYKKINDLEQKESDIFKHYKAEQNRFHTVEKRYQLQIAECIEKLERYQQKFFKQNENLMRLLYNHKLRDEILFDESMKLNSKNPTGADRSNTDNAEVNPHLHHEQDWQKDNLETERDYRSHLNPKHLPSDVRLKTQYLQRLQNTLSNRPPNSSNKPPVFSMKNLKNTSSPQNISFILEPQKIFYKPNVHTVSTMNETFRLNYSCDHCASVNKEPPNMNVSAPSVFKELNQSSLKEITPSLSSIKSHSVIDIATHYDRANKITQNNYAMSKGTCFVQSGIRRNSYCTPEAPFNSAQFTNTVSVIDCFKINK